MELYNKSAHELSKMLAAKEISAVELTENVFAHIADTEPKVDAYITLNGQLCLDAQSNILFGNSITGESKECIIRLFHEKTSQS